MNCKEFLVLAVFLIVICLSKGRQVGSYKPERMVEIYPPVANSSQQIYFGLMMSFNGSLNSSGIVPAVQVALDTINNMSLLGNFTLHYVLYDSQCDRTTALNKLFSIVNGTPREVALIGAGCSSATLATAEISHYFDLTQISCVSNAEELSDRTRFKKYYQMLPPEGGTASIFASIIQEYNWKRVTAIVQVEPGFIAILNKLKTLLSNGIINSKLIYIDKSSKIGTESETYFVSGSRIYILLMTSASARQILCKAYHKEMHYPKYIFLTYGTYEPNWWVPPSDEEVKHECRPQDRALVLHNTISASNFQFIDETNSLYLNQNVVINGSEFLNDYQVKLNQQQYSNNSFSSFCFDATWTLALAINKSLKDNENVFNESLIEYLQSTSFTGLSGLVKFDEKGIREVQNLSVFQYRKKEGSNEEVKAVLVANIYCNNNSNPTCTFQYTNGQDKSKVWKDGVPYDGVHTNITVTLHPTVSTVLGSLSLAGVIFTFICLLFNYAFRDRKIIRLTSPRVNYVICLGCILLYFSNAILSVQPTVNGLATSILCILNLTAHSVGYTIAFATILAKLGRIYLIFRSTKKKITIKDKHLFIFIFIASAVPVIIFITSAIYTGIHSEYNATLTENTERKYHREGIFDNQTDHFHYKCISNTDKIIAVAVSYGYIFFLKLIALWLAFQIRKVKIIGLNDSRYIAAIVYINSILVAINIVVYFSLSEYITVFAILFGANTLIYTTVIVGLVFLPKMISLCKNPKGDGIFEGKQDTGRIAKGLTSNQPNNTVEVEKMKNRIHSLERTVKDLKSGVSKEEEHSI